MISQGLLSRDESEDDLRQSLALAEAHLSDDSVSNARKGLMLLQAFVMHTSLSKNVDPLIAASAVNLVLAPLAMAISLWFKAEKILEERKKAKVH